jgi:hypothetical protein
LQRYAPQHQMTEKAADWFAPKTDGAMTENCYGISLEFPVVALGDMQIIAQDETLTSTCAGDGRRVSIRTE